MQPPQMGRLSPGGPPACLKNRVGRGAVAQPGRLPGRMSRTLSSFYNAGWLGEMLRSGLLPKVQTDNLFVERATEPEAFDHKICGRFMAGSCVSTSVRKARLLQDIGAWPLTPELICPHVTWSLRRIARFLEDTEDKTGRLPCEISPSRGRFRRFHARLLGNFDRTPRRPHRRWLERIPENTARDLLQSLARRAEKLQAATGIRSIQDRQPPAFRRGVPAPDGIRSGAGNAGILAADGKLYTPCGPPTATRDASKCYPAEPGAGGNSRPRREPPRAASAHIRRKPGILTWPESKPEASRIKEEDKRQKIEGSVIHDQRSNSSLQSTAYSLQPSCFQGIRFAKQRGWSIGVVGAILTLPAFGDIPDKRQRRFFSAAGLTDIPAGLDRNGARTRAAGPELKVARDARNTGLAGPIPERRKDKGHRDAAPARRGLPPAEPGKPGKALRSWNNAQELPRRGLNTPAPLAFLTRQKSAKAPAIMYARRFPTHGRRAKLSRHSVPEERNFRDTPRKNGMKRSRLSCRKCTDAACFSTSPPETCCCE